MSDQDQSAIVVTAAANWASIPGRTDTAACMELVLRRRAEQAERELFIEEIRLEPPRRWKPGTVFVGQNARGLSELSAGSSVLKDSRSTQWELTQRITRDAWTLILCNTQPDIALPNDFSLGVAILLENVGPESTGNVLLHVDTMQASISVTIPTKSTGPAWIVHLESDPAETNALVRGQELVLRWDIQNIEGDAELRGSLTGANTMRLANGDKGQRTVRALGDSVYSLTATVSQDGKLVEVVRRVHVDLAVPQFGLNLEFVPASVFPGGPVVCYRSAYNVRKIQFARTGGDPSLAAHNYAGKETTIVDTFVVPSWPDEGRTWTPSAVYTSRDGGKSVHATQVTGIAPSKVENSLFQNLLTSFGTDDSATIHGMAAGAFIVTSADAYSQIVKREWIAIATTSGLELWARDPAVGEVKAVADVQARKWKNNWLNDALAGIFLGVGAANDVKDPNVQCIVAIRKRSDQQKIAEVIEIELPLREENVYRCLLAISDVRFLHGPIRVRTGPESRLPVG